VITFTPSTLCLAVDCVALSLSGQQINCISDRTSLLVNNTSFKNRRLPSLRPPGI